MSSTASEEVLLRRAALEDLAQIVEICGKAVAILNADGNFQWNSSYPLQSDFERDIKDNVLWVAVVGGNVAGFAALTCDQPDEYAEVGLDISETCIVPHRVAVDPIFRGKGIAVKFMQIAEALAKEAGYKYVRVDTNSMNIAMQNLFVKLGYQYCGPDFKFKEKPPVNGVEMTFKCYQKIMV